MDEARFVWSRRRAAQVWVALLIGTWLEIDQLHASWSVMVLLAIALGVGLAIHDVRKGTR